MVKRICLKIFLEGFFSLLNLIVIFFLPEVSGSDFIVNKYIIYVSLTYYLELVIMLFHNNSRQIKNIRNAM